MGNPFWFNLIKQWKEVGMGHYGVSFPFLVGAVSRQSGEAITKEYIETLFQKMINDPVKDYYCEVRWCENIDEPVVSIEKSSAINNKAIQARFESTENHPSFAFTTDLMSMFNLNCSTKEECIEKLISRTLRIAEEGMFSKNKGIFGDFTLRELEFIENVVASTTYT